MKGESGQKLAMGYFGQGGPHVLTVVRSEAEVPGNNVCQCVWYTEREGSGEVGVGWGRYLLPFLFF